MPALRLLCLLLLGFVLSACRHPLAVVGQGDIIEELQGNRGCTYEEFQQGADRCENNAAVGEDYIVRYRAEARPGWEFARWEGTACDPESVFPSCEYNINRATVDLVNQNWPDTELPPTIAVFRSTAVDELVLSHVRDITVHNGDTEFASAFKFSKPLSADDVLAIGYATVTNGVDTWMRVHDFTDPEDDLRSREIYGSGYSLDEDFDQEVFLPNYPGIWFFYANYGGESKYIRYESYGSEAINNGGQPLIEPVVSAGAPFIGGFEVYGTDYLVEGPYILGFSETVYQVRKYDKTITGSAEDIALIRYDDDPGLDWDLFDSNADVTTRRWINFEEGHAALVANNVIHFMDVRNPREPEIYRQVKLSSNSFEFINDIEKVRWTGIGGIEDTALIATTDYGTYMTYYTELDNPFTDSSGSSYASEVIDQPGDYIDVRSTGAPGRGELTMDIGHDIDQGDIYRYELYWDNDAGKRVWTKTAEVRNTFIGGPRALFQSYYIFQTAAGYSIYEISQP